MTAIDNLSARRATAVCETRPAPTVTIDDQSDPGAWATAIAHTPHLAAQVRGDEQEQA